MPDIQTEMQKILQAWEQPETIETTETTKEETVFTPTTNTSRASFEIVRDNPYKTKNEYIKLLGQQGHKKASTSSLLAQMVKQGLLAFDDAGLMHANQNEYRPLKSAKTIAKKNKLVKTNNVITSKKYKTKEVPVPGGIAALVAEHNNKDRVQEIMDTISLPDAKRLYRALAEYFGSV